MQPFEVPWKYAPGLIDAAIELNAAECFSRVYFHTSFSLKHACVRTHTGSYGRTLVHWGIAIPSETLAYKPMRFSLAVLCVRFLSPVQ